MLAWKKEQAVLQEKMKEERKADNKRRRLQKAKEKRKNEKEMMKQLRAADKEYYAVKAKESGDPSQVRELSAMGALAAAAAAASTTDGGSTARGPTAGNSAVSAGTVAINTSGQAGLAPGHFGIAATGSTLQAGLVPGALHGASGRVAGYSMEGEAERALFAAGEHHGIASRIQAQQHPTSPAAALLRAYALPGAQAGGSALSANRFAHLDPSVQAQMQMNPSSYSALMRAYAARGGNYTGTAASSVPSGEYLQQVLAQEDRVREQLARARAQEAAALAQMRAQFHEQTRMQFQAERERIRLSLRQCEGGLTYPYPGMGPSRSQDMYLSAAAAARGLATAPPQAINENLTGNMLVELIEARRRETARAGVAQAPSVAQDSSAALPPVPATQAPSVAPPPAAADQDPPISLPPAGSSQDLPPLAAAEAPAAEEVEETPASSQDLPPLAAAEAPAEEVEETPASSQDLPPLAAAEAPAAEEEVEEMPASSQPTAT